MILIKVTENVFSSNSRINVPLNSVATLNERKKKNKRHKIRIRTGTRSTRDVQLNVDHA